MLNISRLRSGALAVFFTFWASLFPVTAYAQATPPVNAIAAVMVRSGTSFSTIAATAGRFLLSANGVYLGVSIASMALMTPAGQQVIARAVNAIQPTPAGWSSPTTPPLNTNITPGAGVAPVYTWGATAEATPEAACQKMRPSNVLQAANVGPEFYARCVFAVLGDIGSVTRSQSCPNGGGVTDGMCSGAPTCSPGYGLNAAKTTCVLTNAAIAMKPSDGMATMIPSAGGWVADPQDPDPVPATLADPTALNNAGATPFNGPYVDPLTGATSTLPQVIVFSPTASGGIKATQAVQTMSPAGSGTNPFSIVTATTLVTDPAGVVTQQTTTTQPGTLATVIPGVVADPVTLKLDLPTDYNREATQQKLVDAITAPTAAAMPDQAALVDAAKAKALTDSAAIQTGIQDGYGIDKGLWFSWVWTPPVGNCTPTTGTISGTEVSIDYCGYVQTFKDIGGWLFALYGAWTTYGQLFRREG